jgi:choline dehydrogenase-like flavoprotein
MAIIDARTLPNATEIEADLIIIGGGMAGIALAREWAGANKSVAILESGGRAFEQETQDLYAGSAVLRAPDNADRPLNDYPIQSRFRALGGSGHIWGGKCVPLDESDFATRDWLPMTGWPMTRTQMLPYYNRACALLQIDPIGAEGAPVEIAGRPAMQIGDGRGFFSAPRNFSNLSGGADAPAFDRFRTEFAEAANVNVYLHANVREIVLHRRRGRVERLDIACLGGGRHTARGRAYVLATGGIENARLLLASNSVRARGVGNESDLVGRCFMGHMNYSYVDDQSIASALSISDPNQNMTLYSQAPRDGIQCVLASSLEGQRQNRIVNFTVTISEPEAAPRPDTGAILRLSGAIDRGAAQAGQFMTCYFKTEQLPNLDSRVLLDTANADALEMPRVRLEWNFSRLDLDMLEASVNAFAAALGADGKGRVCWPAARSEIVACMTPARHHMGTTRMHADEEHGVVNTDSRMHGVDNLYVAGSSVFPTSGNANPTLTLLAMTMRLSDHLKRRLGARQ